jgi:hypothetical protein
MPNYLDFFPKPLLADLVRGRCIPFVGAGMSRNADLPASKTLPDWEKMGRDFAAAIPSYDFAGALDAISAYAHEYSRGKLIEALSDALLIREAKPGAAHRAFCDLPFELVCTTNFEFLLERGYEAVGRYCYPVIEEEQLALASPSPGAVMLLKLHGDLHHPTRITATEEDYDGFIDKYPLLATFLANLLIQRTALFIGYSLDDPDFRTIWQVVGERLGSLRRLAYVIGVAVSPQVVGRYDRRGVRVINLPGRPSDYPRILADVFTQLRDHWLSNVMRESTITKEDAIIELSLPRAEFGRLCFLMVPARHLAFYRTEVFPIAQRVGFTPVTAEEILSPGDNVFAKVVALSERAEILIADVSSAAIRFELSSFLNKKRVGQRLIVIVDELQPIPSDLAGVRVIARPRNFPLDSEQFLGALSGALEEYAGESQQFWEQQPLLLLEKSFYGPAVVAAFSLLEASIQQELARRGISSDRLHSVPQMVTQLQPLGVFPDNRLNDLRTWTSVRNTLVHRPEQSRVTRDQATQIVQGIYEIIRRISGPHA